MMQLPNGLELPKTFRFRPFRFEWVRTIPTYIWDTPHGMGNFDENEIQKHVGMARKNLYNWLMLWF